MSKILDFLSKLDVSYENGVSEREQIRPHMESMRSQFEELADRPDIIDTISEGFPPLLQIEKKEITYQGKTYYYDQQRKIHNRYYRFMPKYIAMCFTTQHVQSIVKMIPFFDGPIRVCSGRHDHEGECMGTDALVIDLSGMNSVQVFNLEKEQDNNYAIIDPGIRFIDLITQLNQNGVGIPHGTCHSVRIAGFSFGGGWGPWTRAKGMGCESLAGVTIVLGDGTVKELWDEKLLPKKANGEPVASMTDDDRKLLWALRGGGGMSYGIVTSLVYKTFQLPPYTTKFTVSWKNGKALEILEKWEEIISDDNPDLLGTNLKIMAKSGDDQTTGQGCYFYGYYQSSDVDQNAIRKVIGQWFHSDLTPDDVTFQDGLSADPGENGLNSNSFWGGLSAWDRVIDWKDNSNSPLQYSGLKSYEFIPPEVDDPAPRKITSKLVKAGHEGGGLGKAGREILIQSLQSDLLEQKGFDAGLACYITLGAISGSFYTEYNSEINKKKRGEYDGSAFPYKSSPYTIQYQVWWNQNGVNKQADQYVNKALDWLEWCRDLDFPQTYGAFISFKDASIPTAVYFQESYAKLKDIKKNYANDPLNRLSTRKTII